MKFVIFLVFNFILVEALYSQQTCDLSLVTKKEILADEFISRGFILNKIDSLSADGIIVYNINPKLLSKSSSLSPQKVRTPKIKVYESKTDTTWFVFDENNNNYFGDDRMRFLYKDEPQELKVTVLYKQLSNHAFTFYALLNIEEHSRYGKELLMKPLIKYEIQNHDLPHVGKIIYYPHSMMSRIMIYSKSNTLLNDRQNIVYEPFKIKNDWYAFEHSDLMHSTIELRKLAPKEKPYGYQEGHYVNKPQLAKLIHQRNSKLELGDVSYSLHHFWGPWCGHCKVDYEKLRELEQAIENVDERIFNYCFVFSKTPAAIQKDSLEMIGLIEDGIVSENQIFLTPLTKDTDQNTQLTNSKPFAHPASILDLFYIHIYPSYYIVDQQGEIVLRHTGRLTESAISKIKSYLSK